MNRVAVVTGGAGAIGAAISRRLSSRGYTVVVADLNGDAARALADEIGGTAVTSDASDFEQNRALFAHAVERHGRLDLAALTVGINSGQPAHTPLDPVGYRRTVAVNVDSVVFGIEAATPALMAGGGAIVVACSLAALAPEQSNPVYTLTKSAVLGYVRAMAIPLSQHGITINAICPAFVDTPMLGTTRHFLEDQQFPLLTPDDIAATVDSAAHGGRSGEAWALVAGQPPTRYDFPAIPPTLNRDGTPAMLVIPAPAPRVASTS
ncbi:NAD(P)-dependent dehydrogenase (short-subunit alcohol dehydrogenase family) [Allocatelliglobosispora scoriae]|uniref:NAD(P)-dependent dehydrogenase (Short-subunit alcohol dehydrogenase family) n=1 Tax=Allocatelliglobosispora scoriae TaxID=643052 RepID=A0A841C1S6_9ACTN|nr:SDR family NAD(P)-dependent oxidoreductase [Allocatelliglobosispora scoriae]MBB5873826.1 NAD(P)-dependent dehydrogenase (short-subunit alcohol dehydrogenase family) [Allocatelliglobosispora scoriae]